MSCSCCISDIRFIHNVKSRSPLHLLLLLHHFLFLNILLIHLFQLLPHLPSYTSSSSFFTCTSSSFTSSLLFLFTLFNFLLLFLSTPPSHPRPLSQPPHPPFPFPTFSSPSTPPPPPSPSSFPSYSYNFLLLFPLFTVYSFSSTFLNG